jgi:hypothetical protein
VALCFEPDGTLQKCRRNGCQRRRLVMGRTSGALARYPPVHSQWTLNAVAGPCSRAPPYFSSQYQVDRNAPRLRLIGGGVRTRGREGA